MRLNDSLSKPSSPMQHQSVSAHLEPRGWNLTAEPALQRTKHQQLKSLGSTSGELFPHRPKLATRRVHNAHQPNWPPRWPNSRLSFNGQSDKNSSLTGLTTPPELDVSDEDEGLGKSPSHHKDFAPSFPPSAIQFPSRIRGRSSATTPTNPLPEPRRRFSDTASSSATSTPTGIPRSRGSSRGNSPVGYSRPYRLSPSKRGSSSSRNASPVRRVNRERAASITRLASDLETAKDDLNTHLANTIFNHALREQLGTGAGEKNLPKALEHYEMAVNLGHTKSMINAARIYESGPEDVQNFPRAKELLLLACRHNDLRALTYMGKKMCYGDEKLQIPKNFKRALELLRKGIKYDSPDAMLQLSKCYMTGLGFPIKNPTMAFSLCKSAAQMGHSGAEFNLGLFYATGKGVERSLEKANKWYTRAAARGHKAAKRNLKILLEGGDSLNSMLRV